MLRCKATERATRHRRSTQPSNRTLASNSWLSANVHRSCRNLLAACVNADGSLEVDHAHVVVVYDNRNPAFAPGGQAHAQWSSTVRALRFPRMLRKVSWQRVVRHLATVPELKWLVEELRVKYGIIGEASAAT